MKRTRIVFSIVLLASLTFILSPIAPVFAVSDIAEPVQIAKLSQDYLNIFSKNNILFYDPFNCRNASGSGCGEDIIGTTQQERLIEVVEKYGIFFMNAQIEYGIPWEIPIIHSIDESNLGTANPSVAHGTEECGYYNWQGYKYGANSLFGISEAEMGDCKVYHSDGGFGSQYKNLADMYMSYYVDYLRNGAYDAAFEYASPTNFNPREFLRKETDGKYCAVGCSAGYLSVYDSNINTIHKIAAEHGWPTSEELMKQYNIPKGGNWSDTWGDIKKHIDAEPHSLSVDCSSMTTLGDTSGVSFRDGGNNSSSLSGGGNYTNNVTWKDGWIADGLEGYVKEPAIGSGYILPEEAPSIMGGHTQDYRTDGKPNKILLHSTEGEGGVGNSGLALYGKVTKGGLTGITPAHFTIDLQKKKVFQHFSIDKPSDAIIEDLDAGIQIEIIGYMDMAHQLSLFNFSDEEWAYLAKLLVAISDQTGIKLESSADWTHTNRYSEKDFRNYTGVLGHMHAPSTENHNDPGDIWSKIENAIKRIKPLNTCKSSSSGDLASYVLKYAWTADDLKENGKIGKTTKRKPDYEEVVRKRQKNGEYVGGCDGNDCGGFVTTLMIESGYEPNYNYGGKIKDGAGNTTTQEKWLKENWEFIGNSGGSFDTSQLQQGDVFINDSHTYVFVGDIDGFGSNIASASYSSSGCSNTRAPQADRNTATESGYRIYRKKR